MRQDLGTKAARLRAREDVKGNDTLRQRGHERKTGGEVGFVPSASIAATSTPSDVARPPHCLTPRQTGAETIKVFPPRPGLRTKKPYVS